MTSGRTGSLAFPLSPFFEIAVDSGGVDRDTAVANATAAVEKLAPQLRVDADNAYTSLLRTLLVVVQTNEWETGTLDTARQASDTIRDVGPLCGLRFGARVTGILSDILDDVAADRVSVSRADIGQFALAFQLGEAWAASVSDAEVEQFLMRLEEIGRQGVPAARAENSQAE